MSISFLKWLFPLKQQAKNNENNPSKPDHETGAADDIDDFTANALAQAKALKCEGRVSQALLLLNTLPETKRSAEIWIQLADLYAQTHDWISFDEAAQHAIMQTDHPDETQLQLGEICFQNKHLESALDWFHVAVALNPELVDGWIRLGDIHAKLNHLDLAISNYEEATHRASGSLQATAFYQLGQMHHVLKNYKNAHHSYQEAVTKDPNHIEAWMNLGNLSLLEDRPEDALNYYDKVSSLSNASSDTLLAHKGTALRLLGRWTEAEKLFQRAWALNPRSLVACWYLAQCLLALERWKEGWSLYHGRFSSRTVYRPTPFPRWNTQAIPGKTLLLLAEQGLGDEIMFASCIPDALRSAEADRVLVECDPRLVDLYQRSFPSAHFIASSRSSDGSWLPADFHIDYQYFTGDLPALYRSSDSSFPAHRGYLIPSIALQTKWGALLKQRAQGKLKVGISWRGGTPETRSAVRSLSIEHFLPILQVPDVYFISLQYGSVSTDLNLAQQEHGITIDHFAELIPDYDATAAVVSQLDVVISVCTSLVHLSGALNTQTWVLTPLSPEWRYTAYQTRMKWYPSVTLIRQATSGQWSDVCNQAATQLRRLTELT